MTTTQTLTCDHCKRTISSGTCHRTDGGIEFWCDHCLDAYEAEWGRADGTYPPKPSARRSADARVAKRWGF